MLHHISLPVSDMLRSTTFYDKVLSRLGYWRVSDGPGFAGYGLEQDKDKFAIKLQTQLNPPNSRFHLAFSAPDRDAVDAFHSTAILMGAKDEGAPGTRPHYGDHYYAAFVVDHDGHRLEAVCNST